LKVHVAQELLHDLDGHTGRDQSRRVGVAKSMSATMHNASALDDGADDRLHRRVVEHALVTTRSRHDELGMPLRVGQQLAQTSCDRHDARAP